MDYMLQFYYITRLILPTGEKENYHYAILSFIKVGLRGILDVTFLLFVILSSWWSNEVSGEGVKYIS
jgi:hypothetical protein